MQMQIEQSSNGKNEHNGGKLRNALRKRSKKLKKGERYVQLLNQWATHPYP